MTNLEKYEQLFMRNLKVKREELDQLKYRGIRAWDSLGHMDLIADLEETFDIQIGRAHV